MLLIKNNFIIRLAVVLWCVAVGQAQAQYPFDVPFVPTPQVVVDEMLRLARVGPLDYVIDLGSGDGRIPITAAAKYGARGLGVDLDPELHAQSEEGAREAGVDARVKFINQDLFKTDISEATVVTMYLLPNVVKRLRPKLLELKPGTRIVSHDFDMDEWKPDHKTTIRKNVFLWVVPANVGGRWQARVELPGGARDFEFEFRQKFQELDGLVRINGQLTQLWESSLESDRIRFVIVDNADRENEASLYFEGRVRGEVMEGEIRRGVGNAATLLKWRAVKVAARQ
jgi:SAM-dependent methyltransferase